MENHVKPAYYTVKEVATILRFSIYTVRKLAKCGAYGAVRIGGQWRFPQNAFSQESVREGC